jgi:branched-chain amino acid transport system permease protein
MLVLPYFLTGYTLFFLFLLLNVLVVAESYDILSGYTGYVNLGIACFWGLGAYTFAILVRSPVTIFNESPLLPMVLSGFVSAVFAALISFPLFRLKGAYFSLSTLALLWLMKYLAINFREITGGSSGIRVPFKETALPAYYIAFALAIIIIVMHYRISRSKLGLALSCIKEDEECAQAFGINSFRAKAKALIIGAFFAAFMGGCFMYRVGSVVPETVFGMENGIPPVVAALAGGSGQYYGPLIGCVIIMFIRELIWIKIEYFHLLIYGLILIFAGLFVPEGIIQTKIFKMISKAFIRIRKNSKKPQGGYLDVA